MAAPHGGRGGILPPPLLPREYFRGEMCFRSQRGVYFVEIPPRVNPKGGVLS